MAASLVMGNLGGQVHGSNSSRPCGCEGSERSALAMQGSDLLYSAMRPARTAIAVFWWVARSTASARHLQGNTGRIVPAHPTQCAFGVEVRRLMNLPRPPIHQGLSHRLFQIFSCLCTLCKCGNDIAYEMHRLLLGSAMTTHSAKFVDRCPLPNRHGDGHSIWDGSVLAARS